MLAYFEKPIKIIRYIQGDDKDKKNKFLRHILYVRH